LKGERKVGREESDRVNSLHFSPSLIREEKRWTRQLHGKGGKWMKMKNHLFPDIWSALSHLLKQQHGPFDMSLKGKSETGSQWMEWSLKSLFPCSSLSLISFPPVIMVVFVGVAEKERDFLRREDKAVSSLNLSRVQSPLSPLPPFSPLG
jgi:hypothetical protein